jgi:hypothetical protein
MQIPKSVICQGKNVIFQYDVSFPGSIISWSKMAKPNFNFLQDEHTKISNCELFAVT